MRSPLSVRRPHISQQLTNRRKNLGKLFRSQRRQFQLWLQTAVLPDPVAEKRQQVFDALSLDAPQQPVNVANNSKKNEKKKAKNQNTKEEEAQQKLKAQKEAQKAASRKAAEAKKRAAEEEEHKKWKAEQERIEKEQAAKEEELKKLKEQQKKLKSEQAKNEKNEKAKQTDNAPTSAQVEKDAVQKDEIVLKEANSNEKAPATPTNTPAEPAEYLEPEPAPKETAKKNKKNKNKKVSESEPASALVVEDPISEPVIQKETESAPPTKIEEPIVEKVETPIQQQNVEENDKKSKKSKKNKKTSESEPVVVAETRAENVAAAAQKPTADDSMDFLDFVTAKDDKKSETTETEVVEQAAQPAARPTAESLDFLDFVTAKDDKKSETTETEVVEQAAQPAARPTAESLDFLDFVTAKPEKEEIADVVTAEVETVVSNNEEAHKKSKKSNKKNKNKNSESESTPTSIAPTPAHVAAEQRPTADNLDFLDFVTAKPEKTDVENVASVDSKEEEVPLEPPQVTVEEVVVPPVEVKGSKKNKKNKKKGSGNSESSAQPEVIIAPAEPVQEPTFVEIPANGNNKNEEKGSPGSDKENSGHAPIVNGGQKGQQSVEELNYEAPGETTGETKTSKNKKNKNKKNKNSNSISENEPKVIATLKEDQLDELADNEVEAITGAAGSNSPPIQVNEVTSSEVNANGATEKTTTIKVTQSIDNTNPSPTQFKKNVQELVAATLEKHSVQIDPTMKMRIDAQLIKMAEKKPPAIVMEHKNFIKPLPMELHISRPSTPSRDRVYKLLPKDILFCARLIDAHGDDYAAMVNDEGNLFKENARSLQRKIRVFKESQHYKLYLRSKEENVPLQELLDKEYH